MRASPFMKTHLKKSREVIEESKFKEHVPESSKSQEKVMKQADKKRELMEKRNNDE